MDAALRIFEVRGIYGPTVEDITEAADVAKGTFYNYFNSKNDLIAALLHQAFETLLGEVDNKAKCSGTRKTVLQLLLQAHTDFFQNHSNFFLILHQARGWIMLNNEKNKTIRAEYARYVDHLAAIVSGTLWGRRQRSAQLHRTARAIAGYCAGVMSYEHILGRKKSQAPNLSTELQHLISLR